MEKETIVLICYLLGALLRLLEKARVAVHFGTKDGKKTAGTALKEWAFEKSIENGASWTATIAVVWVCGYLYVNQIPEFLGFKMPQIIVAAPVGFLIGCLMEQWAPNMLKYFASKLPFSGTKEDS